MVVILPCIGPLHPVNCNSYLEVDTYLEMFTDMGVWWKLSLCILIYLEVDAYLEMFTDMGVWLKLFLCILIYFEVDAYL